MNTTVTVTMPGELKQVLQTWVAAGRYRSLSAAVMAGVKKIVKTEKKDDEAWVSEELVRRVKRAEQEPIEESREWDGQGSFVQFVRDKSSKVYGDKD